MCILLLFGYVSDGDTALMLAAAWGHLEVVLVQQAGADKEKQQEVCD